MTKYDYTAEDRKAIRSYPVPNWVVKKGNTPIPHKTVHVEGLSVRECRALMRGITHQLQRKADVTLTHTLRAGYVKTVIS